MFTVALKKRRVEEIGHDKQLENAEKKNIITFIRAKKLHYVSLKFESKGALNTQKEKKINRNYLHVLEPNVL